jgi:hemoglobin-like flavoprotein
VAFSATFGLYFKVVLTTWFSSLVKPMLTKTQIRLVQESWRWVMTQYVQAAHAFYQHLFELRPEYQLLFTADVAEQGHKLVRMMDMAVTGLRKFDMVTPAFETLARRHLNYQVTEEMYGPMGEALLATLRQLLGARFTPEVEDAWREMYQTLAQLMTSAAYQRR